MVKSPESARKFDDRLRQLRSDIDVIKFRALREDLESELNELIYDLEEKFSVAEQDYRALTNSDRGAWTQLKTRFDRTWEEAAYAIDRAKARLLH